MKKLFLIPLFAVILLAGCSLKNGNNGDQGGADLSIDDAKTEVTKLINEFMVQPGTQFTIDSMTEEYGLYKVVVKLNGQSIESYVTKNVSIFFPQAMNIADMRKKKEEADKAAEAEKTAQAQEMEKSDKPVVELFVMSHCPFGTQIEKGILPVLETLGDSITFELKFCDYAMHGEQELDEQLNQYCIQKNFPDKLTGYLSCFLKEGKTADCVTELGFDQAALSSCIAETDSTYKVKELFKDQTTWISGKFPQFNVFKEDTQKYSVKGSPALVVNGKTVSAGRDPKSLLDVICSGFNTAPEACKAELPATAPSSGFGFEASGTDSAATCG